MFWIALLALAAVVGLVARAHRTHHVVPYLYFCRFPLLAGAALLALPILAATTLRDFLGNWFSETGWSDLAILVFLLLLAVQTFWTLAEAVFLGGPSQFGLTFRRGADPLAEQTLPIRARRALAALTVLVWTAACAVNSPGLAPLLGGAALGAAVFALLAVAIRRLPRGGLLGVVQRWAELGVRRVQPRGAGPLPPGAELTARQARVLLNLILFLLVYLLFAFLGNPQERWPEALPIPAYPLLLLAIAACVLTICSFAMDRWRVPVTPALLAASFLMYRIADEDHTYGARAPLPAPSELSRWEPRRGVVALPEREVARLWLQARAGDPEPVPVIVTASGGGIAAAYWTAAVLHALQREDPDGRFPRALLATSAVSGGSVGIAHYLQNFGPGGPPGERDSEGARERAGRSSLASVAWGWTFPDFARLVMPFAVPDRYDRGWALERAWWRNGLRDESTLRAWRREAALGLRPTSIFNATLVETGQRLAIATHDLEPEFARDAASPVGWFDLHPECDLRIGTAARLSASFPYVSPVARPEWRGGGPAPAGMAEALSYHVADGGYYDNDGVASALEFLNRAAPALREGGVRRILLLRIRASAVSGQQPAFARSGWTSAVLGPLRAMTMVRSASQVDRNRSAIARTIELWAQRRDAGGRDLSLRIHDEVFELGIESSLSWHLTAAEKTRILEQLIGRDEQFERIRLLLAAPEAQVEQQEIQ